MFNVHIHKRLLKSAMHPARLEVNVFFLVLHIRLNYMYASSKGSGKSVPEIMLLNMFKIQHLICWPNNDHLENAVKFKSNEHVFNGEQEEVIPYFCQDEVENPSFAITVWHHEASLVEPNGGGFFCRIFTLMVGYYNV